jgi:hypothetical protein
MMFPEEKHIKIKGKREEGATKSKREKGKSKKEQLAINN